MRKLISLLAIMIFVSLQCLTAQAVKISGKVTDVNSGEPIPGVNVVVKGTTSGVMTDTEGNYTILVPNDQAVLAFSFIGYVSQEIVVGGQTSVNVAMAEDVTQVDEVVVVGYGSMQRSNVTGAITSVKSADIAKVPVPNVVEALRGQISGVRVTRSSGQPGSDVDFTIRGKRSLGAGEDKNNPDATVNANAPLIVVDGIPFTGGKISDINPDDIASIDILKDAAATSIYGSSASNGVVLITTKSGFAGKPSINVTASTSISSLVQKPELYDGKGFTKLKMDALAGNPKNKKEITPEVVLDPIEEANYFAGKEMDWQDELLKQGRINQVGISMTGGTDIFHYYLNGDIYDEKAIVPNSKYDRYSFRLNTDYSPYKFITLGAKVQYTATIADETGISFDANNRADFSDYIGNSPLGRTKDSIGNLVPTCNGDQFQYNPFYRYNHSDVSRKNYRSSVAPFIEIKLFEGLTYKANGFAEIRDDRYTRYLDSLYDAQNVGLTTYKVDFGKGYNYLFDNIVNYNKTFFDKHLINVTGVYGFQKTTTENMIISAQNLSKNYLGLYEIENLDPTNTTNSKSFKQELNPTQLGKAYYVARLAYSYDNRYNMTISRRWDYSSKFGPNNKEGVFSSIALAWNISNEKFFENLPVLSSLKYRISYGEVGNDRIPDFAYLYTASTGSYPFAGQTVTGWTTGESGNYSLKWETSRQFNTGIDFGMLKNRITGTIDYYSSQNVDLLFSKQVPIVFGDADGKIMSNAAETKNWGLEAMLTAKILDGDFKWETTINWSMDRNEVVSLGGEKVDDLANGWFIGQDINVIYDYKAAGRVYQYADTVKAKAMHPDKAYYTAGDPVIVDIDGNDTINEKDKTFLGSTVTPDWYGGMTNTFSYKGFELSILLEAVQGIKKVNYFINNLNGRDNTATVDYWTPEHTSGNFPQPNSTGEYDYSTAVRLQDASFIAIRNISLSYNLPNSLLKNTPIKGVNIYVRGNNLKYFTDYKQAYSPESDYGKYPITKTWTFGFNLTF